MYKNVASQKVAVFAWDNAAGAAKTGDAGNITAEISKDGGASAATDDTNPTELDATDHPGIYIFDMLQAETNADLVVISAVSSTSDIVMRPIIVTPTQLTSTKAGYIDASISTVDTVVDGIQTDLSNGTDGLGALKTLIDAVPTADENWDATESITGDSNSFEAMLTKLFREKMNDMTIVDATGALALRNEANDGNIATRTITDDDTTTTRTDLVWS